MGQGVLQFIPLLFVLGVWGLVIAAVVWLFRTIKGMAETQARMADHLETIARSVSKDDPSH